MPEQKQFYRNYDMDSTSYKYGRLLDPMPGPAAISTDGSNTTVSATTAGTGPFASVRAGDVIYYQSDETRTVRTVATKVSDDEITVDSAIEITGVTAWWFQQFDVGTAVTDGWHNVANWRSKSIHIDMATIAAAGGVDLQIEAKGSGPSAGPYVLVADRNYAAAGKEVIPIGEDVSALRVGLKGGSGFAGTDVVSVWVSGYLEGRS